MRNFKIAGGSVMGRSHRISGKNNQDAYHSKIKITGDNDSNIQCHIVCDGCGDPTSPYNEVGAYLGARLVTQELFDSYYHSRLWNIKENLFDHVVVNKITWELEKLCRSLVFPSFDINNVLSESMLFTICGTFITPETAYFFTIGDGVIFVNGERLFIESYPGNAPPYIAYNLLNTSMDKSLLGFNVRMIMPRDQLENFLIGSDGVTDLIKNATYIDDKSGYADIAQFWEAEEYFSNPIAINTRLASINRDIQHIDWDNKKITKQNGPLHDDTTIIVGRVNV